MTTQMFHRTSFCLVALIAVFAIRGSTCSGEVPKGNDVRSIEIRGGEPLLLTFQIGGQTAKLLVTTLGNCIQLTQIADSLVQVTQSRVEEPQNGAPPSTSDVSVDDSVNRPLAEVTSTEEATGIEHPTVKVGSDEIRLDAKSAEFTPILPADRPDWVGRSSLETGRDHFVSVGSFPDITYEKSLVSLDESLMKEARKYVDEQILHQEGAAEQLSQLDIDWIKANWVVPNQEYDAAFDSASSVYHQAWVELKISERDRRMVEHWWKDIVRHERAKKLGGGMAVAVAGVGMLHLLVGLIARKKIKK